MNYFFGIKSKLFDTKLTIPKFQNKKKIKNQTFLYQALIKENEWKIEKISVYTEDENFFFLDQKILDNNKIFFITDENKSQFEYVTVNIKDKIAVKVADPLGPRATGVGCAVWKSKNGESGRCAWNSKGQCFCPAPE